MGYVSPSGVRPTQAVFRPNALSKATPLNPPHFHKFKPKPTLVWRPKRKELTTMSFLIRETQPPGKSSSFPSVLVCLAINTLSIDVVDELIMPLMSSMVSDVTAAQFLSSNKVDDARYELVALIDSNEASDVVESELLGSNEAMEAKNESACTIDSDESLERDF